MLRFVLVAFPHVSRLLRYCSELCQESGDILANQALASINRKTFHVQGGSIYALYPGTDFHYTVKFIVSLQTISDYLDDLCDRTGVYDESAFRQLHLAVEEAVDPSMEISDYYNFFPYKNDNGYLRKLVNECRMHLSDLPSYTPAASYMKKYAELYSEMQTFKHLNGNIREERLKKWAEPYLEQYPGLSCWEFAAAAGSTLGIFIMYAAASDPGLTGEEANNIDCAYFPWICGLHILLDCYIDSQEDIQTGDLNFTYYYKNLKHCEDRISYFIQRSFECCKSLRYPEFHMTIVNGLLGMYLSDAKASSGLNRLASAGLIKSGGSRADFYRRMCKFLRLLRVI